jgi:hypothetical protein
LPEAEGPVPVLYIIGAGHSGSTLLDIAIGQHPSVMSVGELAHLPKAWDRQALCACGEAVGDCPFWTGVLGNRAEWGWGEPGEQLASLAKWERSYTPHLRWGLTAFAAARGSEGFATYQRALGSLFRCVQAQAGRPIVVDSSKNPLRAYALASAPGVDLRLVHLVRDPRGVAWSLEKSAARRVESGEGGRRLWPSARAAALWWLANQQAEWVKGRLPVAQSLRVRYEDLVAEPEQEMARMGRLLGCDLADIGRYLAQGGTVRPGHTVAGNRLRLQPATHLKPDAEWPDRLPTRDRRVVEGFAGRLMRRYGYEIG